MILRTESVQKELPYTYCCKVDASVFECTGTSDTEFK
jgi:hypothetical protein